MQWTQDYKQDIEMAIDTLFAEHYKSENMTDEEKKMQEAVIYAVKLGDPARLHPMVAMVVYEEILGLTADTALPVFIGLEFLHIAMKIHKEILWISPKETLWTPRYSEKYGQSITLLIWETLTTLGIECLTKWWKISLVDEALHAIDDTGAIRGMTRDLLLNHSTITEAQYIAMHDEEMSRLVSSSFLIGAHFSSAAPEMLLDQLRRFAVFLCRIHQIKKDMDVYESSLSMPSDERERNVVDFLWAEKTKALFENLEFELLKLTREFQSSKFADLIEIFTQAKEID